MKKINKKGIWRRFVKGLRNVGLKISVLLLIFTVILHLVSGIYLYAGVPQRINYQGRLLDSSGKPVTDGSYSITFRIYNVSTGGSSLWNETQSVTTEDGLFNVILGSVSSITLPFDQDYWVGIKVGADSEMTPRHKLVTAPYSFRAGEANNASKLNNQSASYYLDTSSTAQTKSGDLTLSGALYLPEGAIEDSKIVSSDIKDNTIATADIGNDQITSAKVNFNYADSSSKGGTANHVNNHIVNTLYVDDGDTIFSSGNVSAVINGQSIRIANDATHTRTLWYNKNGTRTTQDVVPGSPFDILLDTQGDELFIMVEGQAYYQISWAHIVNVITLGPISGYYATTIYYRN